MTITEVENKVVKVLKDVGVEDVEYKSYDVNLSEYIIDSLSFMGFIIAIEEEFEIEIPDEMLGFEAIQSFKGFSNLLLECVNKEYT